MISTTLFSYKTTNDIIFIVHQSQPDNSKIVKKVVKFVVYLDLLIVSCRTHLYEKQF
jgi:hypothetical protein